MNTAILMLLRMTTPARRVRDERGDVPGWVLVTVMTAGLVAAIWKFAGPELQNILAEALNSVTAG